MYTVALVSQKGGSGKTTIAVHLAVCAQLHGKRVAIIDIDPQASAQAWAGQREAPSPSVVRAAPEKLRGLLKQAQAEQADICFVDTAPHASAAAAAAIDVADLAIVPCQPSFLDLAAIGASVDLAMAGKGQCAVLLNRCPARGGQVQAAQEALTGVSVVPLELHQRVAFSRALNHGLSVQEFEPDGSAAQEILALYRWMCKQMRATA